MLPRNPQDPPCYHSLPQPWTLTSLIGSYLDLAIAYLLLIGSTIAFLTSKLLSLSGLALPCPCGGGLFGRNPDYIHTLLLDSSRTRIESLHTSIRTRFPFDVILNEGIGSGPGGEPLRLTGPEGEGEGDGDEDGEDRVRVAPFVGRRIRQRRISGSRKVKSASVSFSPPMTLSWQAEGLGENFGCQSKEESSVGLGCGERLRVVEDGISMVGEAATATEYCTVEETSSAIRDVHASNGNMELVIKNLERELEEAQAAYAAIYLELEKERSAAATATDEAMAMILRLQSEKAAVQMESRQYQRMIEEKSAYDDEEMEILKEIIMRREREKHVLEKEVEAYRHMMLSGEIVGEKPKSLFDSSDDPTLMLKTICESIKTQEKATSKMKWKDDAIGIHCPDLSDPGVECNIEFQEKGMLTVEVSQCGHCQRSSFGEDAIRYKLDEPQELGFCNEPSSLSREEDAGCEHNKKMGIPVNESDREDQDGDQRGSNSSQFETESNVLDVHVIEDKQNLGVEGNGDTLKVVCDSEIFGEVGVAGEFAGTSNVDISANITPVSNWFQVEQDIRRSCSDMPKKGELLDTLSDNASHFDPRRSSMSAVDSARLKLETEVEILRKRLKTIHQGRENLNFSVEYREKESFQLQLLEEIACQLQEIRKITEPGKSICQASFPPLSSKVNSKKRHCRSVSWELHESA